MKFIKYICIFLLLKLNKFSIVLKQKNNKTVPESNKLQIQFNRIGEPITLESNNFIHNVKTDFQKVEIQTPYQDKMQGASPKSFFDADLHENSQDEILREKQRLEKKKIKFLTQDITENLISDHENIPTTQSEKNTITAYNQMDELEDDLHEALDQTNGKEPILMNPNILKSLVSYLEHLDYVHSKEFGQKEESLPPKLPGHLRSEKRDYMSIGVDVEEREQNVEVLEKQVQTLHTKLLNIRDPVGSSGGEEEDLENEEKDLEGELDNENHIIVDENEEKTIEDNIESIDDAETATKNMDKEMKEELDAEKKKMEDEELELIENTKILDEIEKINERLAEIDSELAELEETGVQENLVKELKEEKETLETKKDLLITEGQIDKKLSPEDVKLLKLPKIGVSGLQANEEKSDYSGSASNYKTIPNLLVVIQNISGAYNTLFTDLPEKSDELPKDTLTQLKEGLLLYAKLRNFIVAVTVNREELKKDMEYVKNNLDSINLSFDEVLGFYDLKDKYDDLKMKADKTNADFLLKDSELMNETESFSEHIRNMAKNIDTIINLDDFIFQETDYLRKNMDDDDTLDAIKKVDATILLLPKLIDVKIEIDQIISEMETGFENVTSKRTLLEATLNDVEKINNGTYEVQENNPSGEVKLGILGLFTLILLLF